jgi:galactokinase
LKDPPQTIDPEAAAESLIRAGMSQGEADRKAGSLRLLSQTVARMNERRARAYFVPGRIEVLGKHVDYAGGQSLTCATEQGFCLVASPRDDWRVRIVEPNSRLEASFPLDPGLEPWAGDWTNYPMTVCRRIARNFPRNLPRNPPRNSSGKLRGCDIAFTSDLPQAAGLSSSSAMIVAVFMAIADVNALEAHPAYTAQIRSDLGLAGYLGAVENGLGFGSLAGDKGVGTLGGSQDHTAILCAQAGVLGRFGYRPVKLESRVTVPDGHVFVIGVSGVHAQKTGNALQQYNRAAELAGQAAGIWRSKTGRDDPHLGAAAGSSPQAITRLRSIMNEAPDAVRQRVEQFLIETYQVVPEACEALVSGDLTAFGELTDRSQQGAETLLGNQVPQTVFLARHARELGAAAASAFGAGFGGSVWALVHRDQADRFTQQWSDGYKKTFPKEAPSAAFITTRAGPAAMRVG